MSFEIQIVRKTMMKKPFGGGGGGAFHTPSLLYWIGLVCMRKQK